VLCYATPQSNAKMLRPVGTVEPLPNRLTARRRLWRGTKVAARDLSKTSAI